MFRPLIALGACAVLCPAADPPAKDTLGDPLPKWVVARLGTERMQGFRQCYWHPDGKRLIVQQFKNAFGEVESFLVDPATNKRLGDFAGGKGHLSAVSMLAFSNDGKLLVSGSLDTTVLLWDLSKEQ